MDIEKKRCDEKDILTKMVAIYCRGQRHAAPQGQLCESCAQLLGYAHARTAQCPRMQEKAFCSNCPVHCYSPDMREGIRAVMRYAGPRMLWHHPIRLIKHALTF